MWSLLLLAEAVLDHLELEALPAQTQALGRPGDVAAALVEAAGDDLSFHLLHVALQDVMPGRFRGFVAGKALFAGSAGDLRWNELQR